MRIKVTVAALTTLVLSLAACGGGSSGSASAGGSYVVGYVNSMSGPVAVYGKYTLDYLKAAVQDANTSGGVNGRKVEIKVVDSAAVGQNAVSATQQMVTKNKPDVLYGLTLGNDCKAASAVATKYSVPLVCATVPGEVVDPVRPYVFGSLAIEPAMGRPAVEFAQQKLKLGSGTKYAVFVGEGGGGEQYGAAVDVEAKKAGYVKVDGELAGLDTVNVATLVSNLVAARPEVVFMEVVGPQIPAVLSGLRAAGNTAPVIAVFPAIGYDGLLKLADPAFYEVVQSAFVTDQNTSDPGVAKVKKILDAAGLKGPGVQNQYLGPQVILAPLGILEGLKACGTECTPKKMATSLETVKLDLGGFVQQYGWSPESHMPVSYLDVISYDPATKAPKTDATGLRVGSPVEK